MATGDCYAAMSWFNGQQCVQRGSSKSRSLPMFVAKTLVGAQPASRASLATSLPATSQNINISKNSATFHYLASWAQGLPLAGKSDHHVLLRVSLIEDGASGSRLALGEPRAQTFQDTYLTVRHQEQCWCNCRSRPGSDGVATEWTITSGRRAHLQEASWIPVRRL